MLLLDFWRIDAFKISKNNIQISNKLQWLKTSIIKLDFFNRISKLLGLVIFAFTWAYMVGVILDSLCPIKIKNHGRGTKSIFKYGLTFLSNMQLINNIDKLKDVCKFLSYT